MKSQIVIAALLSALSVPAFAGHAAAQAAKEMVPLADGGTLYIFKDGKMAQESRFGRAVYLNVGASVSTKDGRNIAITSNDICRAPASPSTVIRPRDIWREWRCVSRWT